MSNYILILEDGTPLHLINYNDDDLESVNNRYTTLIDITDSDNPVEYIDDKWEPLDKR